MQVSRVLRRPRWVVALCCAAVLVPAAVIVSGVAATDDVATSQATPLVDRDYIYGQLFDMSYNDVYRVSGADGPPTDPSRPWNQPATVNGWQEFFQHWKDQLTDKTAMTHDREVRHRQGSLLPPAPRAADEPELQLRPQLPVGLGRRRGHDSGRDLPGPARAARRAPRRHAGLADDRRRGQQPDRLAEQRQRVRRRSPHPDAQQHRQRRRLRRHVGRDDDDGRVPGAAALVLDQRHVSLEDAQDRAARRLRRPRARRHLPARGRQVLRQQPDPAGAAGPVRDVRRDERERDVVPRVPPRDAVLLEQPRQRRRRPVAHVRHRHAVGAELVLPGHSAGASRPTAPRSRRSTRTSRTPSRPASRSRARSTAARFRRRTRSATTTTGSAPLPAVPTP